MGHFVGHWRSWLPRRVTRADPDFDWTTADRRVPISDTERRELAGSSVRDRKGTVRFDTRAPGRARGVVRVIYKTIVEATSRAGRVRVCRGDGATADCAVGSGGATAVEHAPVLSTNSSRPDSRTIRAAEVALKRSGDRGNLNPT
jgi:hypothetical protein